MNNDFYELISDIVSRLAILERYSGGGSSGGAVTSVNGQSGVVVLDADDISDTLTTKKFTTAAEKSKLAGIAAGAEVNVNADWNAVSGDALIQNKPSIPTQYTDEMAQDAVGNALGNGLDYDDATGAISVDETELSHNSLGSKQGGTAGEYYHLTAAELANLANQSGVNTGDQDLSPYLKRDASNDPVTGNLLVKPSTDSLSGFEVQDKDGNVVLSTDTINNRIGIGTASPVVDLNVVNPNNASVAFAREGSNAIVFNVTASLASLVAQKGTADTAKRNFAFFTGVTEVMRFDVNGLVGIGTTLPTSHLSFGGNIARIIALERHTTANTAGNSLSVKAGGATVAATNKAGGTLFLQSGLSTGNVGSKIELQTPTPGASGAADNALATRATIDETGMVVAGNISATNLSGNNTGDQTLPVKATGAEIDAGTNDTKFATPKAIMDSGLAFVADIPVKATGTEIDAGSDDAKFATALALANSHKVPTVTPGTANNVLASDGTDWISASLLTLFDTEVKPTFWADTFWTINQSLWARNMLLYAMIDGDQNDWSDDFLAGTLSNGAALVTGMQGVANTALEFVPHGGGGADEFCWWTHVTRQDVFTEISLVFLVKPVALPVGYGARIINKGDNSSFQIDIVPDGNIRFVPFVGGAGQEQWSASDDVLVGEWNWVICTRRGYDGMQVIYTKNVDNGIRERREFKTAGNMNTNTNTIQVGAIEGWLGFNGLVSNIFVLDRFLTRLEALNFLNNVTVL